MSLASFSCRWPLAAFATSLPGSFGSVLYQIAALGFTHVDLVAEIERPAEQLESIADSGLIVSCLALGRQLPIGHCLDAADVGVRRETMALLQRQVTDAARLGATTAYVVPGSDGSTTALSYFAEGCSLLADYAAARKVRLCVEHVPGRALPTAAAATDWLRCVGNPQLALLVDVGHCLISGEEPSHVIRQAGPQLGYIHLDDNDGVGDLHWPLLTGRLTRQLLVEAIVALQEIGYRGSLSLELNPMNSDPAAALRDGKKIVESAIQDS